MNKIFNVVFYFSFQNLCLREYNFVSNEIVNQRKTNLRNGSINDIVSWQHEHENVNTGSEEHCDDEHNNIIKGQDDVPAALSPDDKASAGNKADTDEADGHDIRGRQVEDGRIDSPEQVASSTDDRRAGAVEQAQHLEVHDADTDRESKEKEEEEDPSKKQGQSEELENSVDRRNGVLTDSQELGPQLPENPGESETAVVTENPEVGGSKDPSKKAEELESQTLQYSSGLPGARDPEGSLEPSSSPVLEDSKDSLDPSGPNHSSDSQSSPSSLNSSDSSNSSSLPDPEDGKVNTDPKPGVSEVSEHQVPEDPRELEPPREGTELAEKERQTHLTTKDLAVKSETGSILRDMDTTDAQEPGKRESGNTEKNGTPHQAPRPTAESTTLDSGREAPRPLEESKEREESVPVPSQDTQEKAVNVPGSNNEAEGSKIVESVQDPTETSNKNALEPLTIPAGENNDIHPSEDEIKEEKQEEDDNDDYEYDDGYSREENIYEEELEKEEVAEVEDEEDMVEEDKKEEAGELPKENVTEQKKEIKDVPFNDTNAHKLIAKDLEVYNHVKKSQNIMKNILSSFDQEIGVSNTMKEFEKDIAHLFT
ncbi:hypothetical protein MKS88_003412 [Plasmodium brasilianum]|uniref:Uncharacterized protein n=1 Tax=Plasmodium brasilianum TaxID=5824 RepID=A0ACB9Y9B8_PLABR|nr:hypothetical protein MKS88_003412 [Plasmodium brasilianum]